MDERRIYHDTLPVTEADVTLVLQRNDVDELLQIVIRVGMHADDQAWAEDICLRLTRHDHFNVRGNAILALGHLARRFSQLAHPESFDAIRGALADPDAYVRGQAESAADDVEHFIGKAVRLC